MTPEESVAATAARLTALDWQQLDYRSWSKGKLMVEYLRRAAQWSRAYGCDTPVPFYDIAACVNPGVRADQHLIDEVLAQVRKGGWHVKQVTPWILHWAALRPTLGDKLPHGLEDPFEPLLQMFERGGGFQTEHGFIEIDNVSVPMRGWLSRAERPPTAGLDHTSLDEIDRASSLKYFGYVMGPGD
ncbi:hypothetical protein [Actinoplanes sp. RD1]|uniref:hypothetical protein n=1 Tax=Actinoplanes sp. RD1 TaxID=3064538 RepID=UPI0027409298|nr:hypothetical protein [Actinoplanes sp. RD1]